MVSAFKVAVAAVAATLVLLPVGTGPALAATDTTPPSPATNLRVTGISVSTVALAWGPATDDVGVVRYEVWRGDGDYANWVLAASVSGSTLSYTVGALSPSTSYTFGIRAFDAANNKSASSNIALATTAPAPACAPAPTTPSSPPEPIVANAVYVSLTGNDATGNGSAATPFRSLTRAQSVVQPGGTVYVRGGVYVATKLRLTKSGTASAPITYAAYPGESVVLDGSGQTFGATDSIVTLGSVHDVRVRGFEVRNSAGGRGMTVVESRGVLVAGNRVHDVSQAGISVSGDNVTVLNNEVWNAALVNRSGQLGTGGWPGAVSSYKNWSTGLASTNITFRGNNVHDSWGEGIDAMFVNGGVVDGNRVTNTYSALIYSDDSRNVSIVNNYLAVTTATYNRRDSGRPANGVLLGSETAYQPLENITVANNLVAGGANNGVAFWWTGLGGANNSYKGVYVFYNTIRGTSSAAVQFETVESTSPAPAFSALKNNILFASGNGAVLSLGNRAAWSITNNSFPSGVPATAAGYGNIAGDPRLVDPQPCGAASGYAPATDSPVRGAGTPVRVTTDYSGRPRSATAPTLGFWE